MYIIHIISLYTRTQRTLDTKIPTTFQANISSFYY